MKKEAGLLTGSVIVLIIIIAVVTAISVTNSVVDAAIMEEFARRL